MLNDSLQIKNKKSGEGDFPRHFYHSLFFYLSSLFFDKWNFFLSYLSFTRFFSLIRSGILR